MLEKRYNAKLNLQLNPSQSDPGYGDIPACCSTLRVKKAVEFLAHRLDLGNRKSKRQYRQSARLAFAPMRSLVSLVEQAKMKL